MSEIKDRIQMILDYYGISQAEFAKRANLSTGYANNPGRTTIPNEYQGFAKWWH